MPVLRPKHEKFAQYLAQGETATDAHVLAGYKPSRFNASKLANNPAVKERVIQITTETADRAAKTQQITKEKLLQWHDEVRQRGMDSGQLSAANASIKEMSVLTGHRIERAEIGGPGEFDHLSDDELLSAIRERWARLDSETQLAISDGSITLNGARRNLKKHDN